MENNIELAIQNSIVALISKKINILIAKWTGPEVFGVGCSIIFLMRYWEKSKMNIHMSWVMSQVVKGILLSYFLDYISLQDTSLTILNMLGVYLLLSNFEENVSSSTQYIFAEKISKQVVANGFVGFVLVAFLYSNLQTYKRLRECCGLVGVQLIQNWLKEQLRDHYMRFFSTVLILYFTGSFSNVKNEMHSFAVYSVSSEIELNFSNSVVNFVILYSVYKLAWDNISKQILNICSTHALINLTLSFFKHISYTDPLIAIFLGGILISLGLHLK